MSDELSASIRVRLPDGAKEQAELAAAVLTAWRQFVAAIGAGSEGAVAQIRIVDGVVRRRRRRTKAEMALAEGTFQAPRAAA